LNVEPFGMFKPVLNTKKLLISYPIICPI